jgi:deoxyribose-phosphate aldolase
MQISTALRESLSRVPPVDAVGVRERVEQLGKRSIKKSAKLAGIELAIRMLDLTTLEGKDSPGRVEQLCRKALRPLPGVPSLGPVAAVCVYPSLVGVAKRVLAGSPVRVASVATGFPSGLVPLELKLEETARAVASGADEIDMVIDRGAFLAGAYDRIFDEIQRVKAACGPAHLKVILETGELGTLDQVRRASWLAMEAGADFIKTSTGKIQPAATPEVVLVMLEAIRDFYFTTGTKVGIKPAGGIRTSKQALQLLVMVKETLGNDWLDPKLFRIGASTLLNDLLMQWVKETTGAYQGEDYFSKD